MNVQEIIKHYDVMLQEGQWNEAGAFLQKQVDSEENPLSVRVSANNELIGCYRNLRQDEACYKQCRQQMEWMNQLQTIDGETAGTLLLNIANAFREIGLHQEAQDVFDRPEELYENVLKAQDYRRAGLYNNYSLCMLELEQYVKAEQYARKALEVIKAQEEAYLEEAVTYQNLSSIAFKQEKIKEACELIERAYQILVSHELEDSYQAGTILSNLAYVYSSIGFYKEALEYYNRAADIAYYYTGESPYYFQILANIKTLKNKLPDDFCENC